MFITNKAQYTCHKTFIWLRVSLTCCTYVLGGGGGAMIFFLINEHLLRGGQKQNPEMIRKAGGLPQNERKNKNIIIAHPLNNL